MPPKRKAPAAASASASASTSTSKRRSKLAKENDISAEEESEIQEAFALFCSNSNSSNKISSPTTIRTIDIRRSLIALNAAPGNKDDLQELIDIADPDADGVVDYEHFLPVAALQVNRAKNERDEEQQSAEVEKAFALFTRGEERDITLGDLKRIALELREDVPESVLRDMVREAKGGGLGGVGKEEFEGVMRRAGVLG